MARKLFGTTGVRKVYGTEFKLDMAIGLGKALGTYLGSGTVLLAHDARTTSPMVEDALAAGIMSTGVNVVKAVKCSCYQKDHLCQDMLLHWFRHEPS